MAAMTKDEAIQHAERIAREWHEAERPGFAKRYDALTAAGDYDTVYVKTVVVRQKYILIDQSARGDGRYLIDPSNGWLRAIKAYGRPGALVAPAATFDGSRLARY